MRHIFTLTLLVLIFAGCANRSEYFTSTFTKDKTTIENIDILADDLYEYILSNFTKNDTVLYIYTSDYDKSFYNYLTSKLRDEGYAITDDPKVDKPIYISYKITKEDDLFLVSWNLGVSKINRIYRLDTDYNKLVPIGNITGFNLLKRGE
ncbi:MAG: hypothetical protein RBQ81_05755 [Arcobacteraceae bacterium]|jgi:hypothetical protein|nr:hypothetical protein [Arcobacteraceae bacterium]